MSATTVIRPLAALGLILAAPTAAWADCATYPSLCGLTVTSTTEQPDLDLAIDVVLMGDGYTTAASWASAAANVIAVFKAQNATHIYNAVPNLYNFHVVNVISATTEVGDADFDDTALGMDTRVYATPLPAHPSITANESKVATAALNAPDVDIIIVVANGSGRANANFPTQLASGGEVRLGSDASPVSHEMAHAVIHIADEYEESQFCSNPTPNEAALYDLRNVTAESTCVKFSTTAGVACTLGGQYCSAGVWRSATGCLMRASGNSATCPVCSRTIREYLLEKRTGLDFAEPWAAPMQPTAGSTVSGTVNLYALVYDDYFWPVRVAFVVDDVFRGAVDATTPGVQLPFDTRPLADGPHTLKVFPDDRAGHAGHSTTLSFSTLNHGTPPTPTFTISSPANAATVCGKTWVSAQSNAPPPHRLTLLLDGLPVAVALDNQSVSYGWDTTKGTAGSHTLQLVSLDLNHNSASSSVTTVTVDQAAAACASGPGGGNEQGLRISVMEPASWAAVGPVFMLGYFVSGGTPPITLELWVDGRLVSPNPLPVFNGTGGGGEMSGPSRQQVLIDSSGWHAGPHEVQIKATDGTHTGGSDPFVVVRVTPAAPVGILLSPSAYSRVKGLVQASVTGYAVGTLTKLGLLVDGTEVGNRTTAPGTIAWDTTAVSDGTHELVVEATDDQTVTGRSPIVRVNVDNTPPAVSITEPTSGATVPPGAAAVGINATDNAGIGLLELLVDGVVASSGTASGKTALLAALTAGSHTLSARATDTAGNTTVSSSITVNVAACTSGGCDDSDSCTTDTCAADGACVHALGVNCCQDAGDCDDGDPCTTHTCNTGTCTSTVTAGCCDYGFACADADLCTLDQCSGTGGTCAHGDAGCCDVVGDCDDGNACTTATCLNGPGGWCLQAWTTDCCGTVADCDDDNPCTTDACATGTCSHTPINDCCNTPTDCDDSVVCTNDFCDTGSHTCTHSTWTNCCATVDDCVTLNPCATPACGSKNCSYPLTAGCCTFPFECDDRDACTLETCVAGACGHVDICCSTGDPACDDQDPCTTEVCNTTSGFCEITPIADCCLSVADCDDLDACTTDDCTAGVCGHTALTPCCHNAGECDDTDVCTTDTCDANLCNHTAVSNCCYDASTCDDGDVCTTDTCDANACASTAIDGCCQDASTCDDGDVCTTHTCDANACVTTPVPDCCHTDDDCAGGTCDSSVCSRPSDVGGPATIEGGCSCTTSNGGSLWALFALAPLVWARRRRYLRT